MKPTFFATPAAFRAWLTRHHAKAKELVVGFRKKATGEPSITWPEAVDQALCFGWIDGIRHRPSSYRQKIAKGSEVRLRRLEKAMAAFESGKRL